MSVWQNNKRKKLARVQYGNKYYTMNMAVLYVELSERYPFWVMNLKH